MSRHENSDIIRRGYEDQRDGKVDPVLAEEDTTRGMLYRTGLRERRREEADCSTSPARVVQTVEGFVAPDGVREGQAVYIDQGYVDRLKKAHDPEPPQLEQISAPAPLPLGGAFDVQVSAPRKKRPAKPADPAQASLF